jgi:hypothetical protein
MRFPGKEVPTAIVMPAERLEPPYVSWSQGRSPIEGYAFYRDRNNYVFD